MNLIGERIAEAVVTFVANAAWQTTVIALAGIAVSRLLRRAPAHLRFWLVALTLVAAVAAPVMTRSGGMVPFAILANAATRGWATQLGTRI